MKAIIANRQDFIAIEEKTIRKALKMLPFPPSKFKVSLVYLNDAEISELNRRYLHKEGPTDVLAFPMEKDFGEVIVSAETAWNEAKERGIAPMGEILLYTIHGILHLLGYDDKSDEEAREMHAIEKDIITRSGYGWHWDA